MYSKTLALASSLVAKVSPRVSSFFGLAQKDSIGASSQQFARRLMLQAIPWRASSRWWCSLAYWLAPIRVGHEPLAGLATPGECHLQRVDDQPAVDPLETIDRPMIFREWRSSTAAR